ncbi:hypothetical protein IQ07DRAFT_370099 [Pyrenochaeta sp. DS3sAY3a]|nr:hypothetical protein IQ07DRAFT_370099 [Pyrenochaeta sp. DS3sAY3a]
MEQPHLLTLPRELRLEIWSYVLTDPSMTNLVLDIRLKPSAPSLPAKRYTNSLHKTNILESPGVCTKFEMPRSESINLHFLRTCRFVYEDALPTLYHSVTFCLRDVQGILPLFLAPLSPFARSHIRYIKLSVRESSRCNNLSFYWALTCAQVAGLAGLRRVDVAGERSLTGSEYFKKSMLRPLLKIKAPKSFLSGFNAEFQTLLHEHEAARKMEGQALIRNAAAAAEVAERLRLEYAERVRQEQIRQEQKSRHCHRYSAIREGVVALEPRKSQCRPLTFHKSQSQTCQRTIDCHCRRTSDFSGNR